MFKVKIFRCSKRNCFKEGFEEEKVLRTTREKRKGIPLLCELKKKEKAQVQAPPRLTLSPTATPTTTGGKTVVIIFWFFKPASLSCFYFSEDNKTHKQINNYSF